MALLQAAEHESLRGLGEAGRLLFEARHSGDLTLVLESGEQERVHKVVVELRSAYFKSLLRYTPRGRAAGSSPKCAGVRLTGFTRASLSAIVEWIYCGAVHGGGGQPRAQPRGALTLTPLPPPLSVALALTPLPVVQARYEPS